jgi:tetratricopeptide (TPR) repeat protein
VSAYHRIRRKQLLREAEGYLELITVLEDRWPLSRGRREAVASRALETLDRLPRRDRERSEVVMLKGMLLRAVERYDEAIGPLKSAAESDPDNVQIWLALAWCYKRIGRLDMAIQSLEEALCADSSDAIVHFNLACYWSLAHNAKLAVAYLARAFDIDSNYRDLVDDEADFDPIRNHPEFMALTSVIV